MEKKKHEVNLNKSKSHSKENLAIIEQSAVQLNLLDSNESENGLPLFRNDIVFKSLRNSEYDLNSALAELPDNSVEAGAQNIWISTKTTNKKIRNKAVEVLEEIAVVDDGCGMNPTIQNKALSLGDGYRPPKPDGSRGIGKFGVGLVMGSLSIGSRIELYSRDHKENPFTYTYLDIVEIEKGQQTLIPMPIPKEPPTEYAELLKASTGTIVITRNCDRWQVDADGRPLPASEHIAEFPHFIARTYRNFIAGGTNFFIKEGNKDYKKIYLHDPLFLLGPTKIDIENASKGEPLDPKATLLGLGEDKITLPIPGSPDKTADVIIKMTLLPQEWRREKQDGIRSHAKARKIPDNEGISVLRAGREVLYGPVSYIIGKKGQAKFLDIDRWWGCEISFPPELDEYFHVRYIKRGAEPIISLRDQIRAKIAPVVEQVRGNIQQHWNKTTTDDVQQSGIFQDAATIMAEASKTQPRGKRGSRITPEQAEKKLEEIANQATNEPEKPPEKKKEDLAKLPYAIVPVIWPQNVLFETEHLLGQIIVKLNISHPFYEYVLKPLCGSIESISENSDPDEGAHTIEQRRNRRGFMLLLLAYAQAESMFENDDDLFLNLRSRWGEALAGATRKLMEKE
ncbi:ATP-binding protein [Nostoc linckia FACHB-104]|nr:ATP-binding protein [Nostoc linckia FACHB-104]